MTAEYFELRKLLNENQSLDEFFSRPYNWHEFFLSVIKNNDQKSVSRIVHALDRHFSIEKFIHIKNLIKELDKQTDYELCRLYDWCVTVPNIKSELPNKTLVSFVEAGLSNRDYNIVFHTLVDIEQRLVLDPDFLLMELERFDSTSKKTPVDLTYLDFIQEKLLPHYPADKQLEHLFGLYIVASVHIGSVASINAYQELGLQAVHCPTTYDEALRAIQYLQKAVYWDLWPQETKDNFSKKIIDKKMLPNSTSKYITELVTSLQPVIRFNQLKSSIKDKTQSFSNKFKI